MSKPNKLIVHFTYSQCDIAMSQNHKLKNVGLRTPDTPREKVRVTRERTSESSESEDMIVSPSGVVYFVRKKRHS